LTRLNLSSALGPAQRPRCARVNDRVEKNPAAGRQSFRSARTLAYKHFCD
jgi:hypothetical protein